MGTVLAVGGFAVFADAASKEAWKKKAVASAKLTGWDGPLEGPGGSSPLDKHSVGALWDEARDAPEPIEIAETETSLRFAAALASVTGRTVWAPAFFAAIRRAAGSGEAAAWAVSADEGGSVLVADAAGRGSFRCLDEDEDVERALAEPEIVRAFALNAGDAPPPTLADLPQREAATTKTNAKGTKAKKDAKSPAKASAKAPALPAKPPPRLKKITARAPGGLQAAARLAGGDVVLIGLFGSWMRGRLETNTWASSPRGLGKQWWITTEGRRIWLGTDDGLFVSDDDGITFVQRRPWAPGWTKPLFVEGAIISADGGELCRSTDDGVTWVQTFPREPSFGAIAIARGTGAHGSRLVAVGIYGRIARSDDLGQTWTMAREGNDEAFHHVCVDGDDVYVLGSSRILRAPITSPGDVVEIGPAPKRDVEFRQVYARDGFVWIAAPLHLLRSRDRGATWEILAKAETVFKDVLVLGPRHLLVATSDQLAYEIEG